MADRIIPDPAARELSRARAMKDRAEITGDPEDEAAARAAMIRALTAFEYRHGRAALSFSSGARE